MRLSRVFLVGIAIAGGAPLAVAAALAAAGLGGPAPLLAAAALAAVLAALAAARLARRVEAPIRRCVGGALEVARGSFGHELPVHGRDELADLTYAFNHMSRELARQDAENRRLIAALEAGWLQTIRSLASAVDAKDPYTRGHSQRVSALAVEIGRELGLSDPELKALEWGGLLHDLGKIGVPDPILGKSGKLTADELAIMREHPAIGAEILRDVEFLGDARHAVRSHHERWDGGGYPDRLAGPEIPLVARVVAAADIFDACTSQRPYQRAMAQEDAVEVLRGLGGTQIDPAVLEALLRVLARRAPADAVRRAANA
jgi:putative nucleotidyltransferase with HDIG domain